MFEWFLPLPLLLGAALIPKGKMPDEKKIEEVFKNRNIGIKKSDEVKYPKPIEKHDNEFYSTYLYSLPLGLPSDYVDTVIPAIKEALNKEIETDFDGGLYKIRVYKNELPEKWSYTEDLLRPGTWEVPIGKNHKGILYHDFEKYPHMLVGGVTRFGKTVFLKEIKYSLVMSNPDDIDLFILDLKGGLEFGHYLALPQVKAVASDIYEATELLAYLSDDLKKQQQYFKKNCFKNIVHTPIKKRKFIIVDEGAELSPAIIEGNNKKYAKYCQTVLSEIARIGGALGYRLIFCTQYPTKEAVPMQVKMNIVARLSFIAAARIASQVILDEPGAEELPSIPGRAIYKIEKQRQVQVPYIDDQYMFKRFEKVFSE